MKRDKLPLRNVVGVLEGKGPLANETVIVGSHYDHLGYGGAGGSLAGLRKPAIHHGADDNGSGTTTVIELARRFAAQKDRQGRKMAFMLFRTARELLINVVKHADATRATVDIRSRDGSIIIQVGDNGKGFDASRLTAKSHRDGYGLFSTRERLDYMGGQMQIQSNDGVGTTVTLTVPIANEGE